MTLALLLALAAAPPEDAAHRADRLEVRRLNRQVAARHRAAANGAPAVSAADGRAYAKARADYAERLAAWRARVAACEGGDTDACGP